MKMNQLPKGEQGSILVWAAVGLGVLIAFAGLATDIPYLYVAQHQAQTAADAGALAGAYTLFIWNNQDKAMADTKAFAGKTPIMGQFLTAAQVDAFAESSTGGTIDQVRCVTHRDVARGNPMPLFMLPVLQLFGKGRATAASSGWDAANVSATATARVVNMCSSNCFKPWSLPDRWNDVNGNGTFDSGTDIYNPLTTGYRYPDDNGRQVTLKIGSAGNTIVPSIFLAIDYPPVNRGNPITGADAYNENIMSCLPSSFVGVGDEIQLEPGNMVGPTRAGVQALIDLDPTAFWDTSCGPPGGCLRSPLGTDSPRLIRIPFFDPRNPPNPGRGTLFVSNMAGFFLEALQSNDVIGRYTWMFSQAGTADSNCGGFLKSVQLVQ